MPQSQLTTDERYRITHLHMFGLSNGEIARRLGRHRATIGRELARNSDHFGTYHYATAQRSSEERRSHASRRYKLDDSRLGRIVKAGLQKRWSPDQIAAMLRAEYGDDSSMYVSHETIYQWIYREHTRGKRWHEKLRRQRKRRRPRIVGERRGCRSKIPGRVGIEKRPAIVDARKRFGDWESDTIEGRKGSGVIATHVERKSRYVRIALLRDKRAETFSQATIAALEDLPPMLLRTLTADNGSEFTRFADLEAKLGLKVYFANPHAPWERGVNENTNGLLRDWFPKGSDFRRITAAQLARVERMLNNRPRKCLNYRTPVEVLNRLQGVALQN